ncbi:MAG: hypothetical protein CL608_00270 [Anaerolineaceae bacterium]|nr:hypothetical protein [Anaerolineaceae bacterium]
MDDWGALEKHCGLAVTVGSNPTLSALMKKTSRVVSFFMMDDNKFEELTNEIIRKNSFITDIRCSHLGKT